MNPRGFSAAAAMQPGEALWGFLHALGAPHDTPSLDLDAQAALYRSMLAGRRMLIVLDNARDSDQVRHLLPGNGACHVIVTSRQRLTGLVAQAGVRPEPINDADQAAAWFAAEHAVLVTLVEDPAWPSTHSWRLARCLVTHLDRHGHWRDFVTTQRAALAAAQQVAGTGDQAYAHRLLARALIRREELGEARSHLLRALALFRDDITGQAHTNYALGYFDVCAGDTVAAIEHTTRARALARASGAQVWEAKALNNIGWCLLEAGHHAKALPYSRQALDLFRELNTDPDGQAHTLDRLPGRR